MILLLSLALSQEDVLTHLTDAGVEEVVLTPREGMDDSWEYLGRVDGGLCTGKISRRVWKDEVTIMMSDCVPTGGALAGKLKEATQGTKNLAEHCDAGLAESCRQLGTRLIQGNNVEKDIPLAKEVLTAGCEGGDAQACTALGVVHRDETGEEAKAGEFYLKGCLGGDAPACPEAGLMAPDLTTAAKAFTAGCDAGDQKSCANLGICYVNGKGVPRNRDRGVELLTTACEAEIGFACEALRSL